MNVLSVESNPGFPDVKIITCQRFCDFRGYFTEPYRSSDFEKIAGMENVKFVQSNESSSYGGVFRGLHIQWEPMMSKLVRVVSGKITDFFLDVRHGSTTFGKIGSRRLNQSIHGGEAFEWIWIPKGFAHGIFADDPSVVQYMCDAEYAGRNNEASINVLSPDIDWSSDVGEYTDLRGSIVSTKDGQGLTLAQWKQLPAANLFRYVPAIE